MSCVLLIYLIVIYKVDLFSNQLVKKEMYLDLLKPLRSHYNKNQISLNNNRNLIMSFIRILSDSTKGNYIGCIYLFQI